MEAPRPRSRQTFVLCFDGTGNKFSGTDADSNILKIYRMLDRSRGDQYTYYQPGIGTYVTSGDLEHTSLKARIGSWYEKAKDSAVGTSFATHVMGGYKFLVRYYNPGDDIYMFGFSRGAYTARFLAEMLDNVGLLSAGNEELLRFAWKTFSQWQGRQAGDTAEEKQKEEDLYKFMVNFKKTFSRNVSRIRFLGLFDTVNSVPRFEAAWMQRSKFPYSCRSSAKVIRHAVAINERRAKFRQDLIAATKLQAQPRHHHHLFHHSAPRSARHSSYHSARNSMENPPLEHKQQDIPDIMVESAHTPPLRKDSAHVDDTVHIPAPQGSRPTLASHRSQASGISAVSDASPVVTASTENLRIAAGLHPKAASHVSHQDVLEVWFPGCHADIGGGWPKHADESWPLSHAPLVWMVHAAEEAGLKFDQEKMLELNCCPDIIDEYGNRDPSAFHSAIHQSGTEGFIHDCLEYGKGLPFGSVLSWRIMEYLPFRRMDLQSDGSWKPIRWPLPCGETRDIPNSAIVHNTVIKRIRQDPKYRPGNLIVGGGGRGTKHAPEKYGTGEWEVVSHPGDSVFETYVKVATQSEEDEKAELKKKKGKAKKEMVNGH